MTVDERRNSLSRTVSAGVSKDAVGDFGGYRDESRVGLRVLFSSSEYFQSLKLLRGLAHLVFHVDFRYPPTLLCVFRTDP